jgi:hypothetical protein
MEQQRIQQEKERQIMEERFKL